MNGLVIFILITGGLYAAYLCIQKVLLKWKLDRFDKSKTTKDKVILHGTPVVNSHPAAKSPFVLKLETYLRMAKIPYEYDGNIMNTFGPKGKTPWISLNGEHIADSQLCIEYFQKKFDNPVKSNYNAKDEATANMVRIFLEDRIFWELALWGFVWGDGPKHVQKFLRLPWIISKFSGMNYRKLAYAQGIGRHSKEDVDRWTYQDLKTVAIILGNNKFLLGDEPCIEDAAVFGFLAQLVWGFVRLSPYVELLKEYPNIEGYCIRMKDTYFPDWEQSLDKQKTS